jgi:hypothetical protein
MPTRGAVAIDTVPLPERVVRIVIPASAANNLESLQKVIVNVAERLGCRPCFSGADCLFMNERDFVVDPATFKVHGAFGVGGP